MTVVYTAARTCELCGGLRDRGSRLEHEGHVGGRYVARPCPHAEGDRHRRQVILTREARAGWILTAGRHWNTARLPTWALGPWVADWYRLHVRVFTGFPWERSLPHVPGGSLESTWLQLDPLEENLGAIREWSERRDAEWRGARSADGREYPPSRHAVRAELVAKLVAAGRQVERTDVPWWRVVRGLPRLPGPRGRSGRPASVGARVDVRRRRDLRGGVRVSGVASRELTLTVCAEAEREVLAVGQWELSLWRDLGDGEPRVRDIDAARVLGFKQARDIRKLIERTWSEGHRPHVRATVARTSMPRGGEREEMINEYWLTEAELLKLCARSRTPVAEAILDEMIAVYQMVRRHQVLAAVQVEAPAPTRPRGRPRRVALPAISEATFAQRRAFVTDLSAHVAALVRVGDFEAASIVANLLRDLVRDLPLHPTPTR